jgi:hypothetical protein
MTDRLSARGQLELDERVERARLNRRAIGNLQE